MLEAAREEHGDMLVFFEEQEWGPDHGIGGIDRLDGYEVKDHRWPYRVPPRLVIHGRRG